MRLDFGCGAGVKNGYEGVDCVAGPHVQHVIDVSQALPWRDGEVEAIHANHILEHMPYWRIRDIIFEWSRVLAPNGLIEIAGPDILKIMAWVRGDPTRLLEVQVDIMGTHDCKYANEIGVVDPGRHKTAICGPMIAWFLGASGVYVRIVDFEKTFRTFRLVGTKVRRVTRHEYLRYLKVRPEWPSLDLYESVL